MPRCPLHVHEEMQLQSVRQTWRERSTHKAHPLDTKIYRCPVYGCSRVEPAVQDDPLSDWLRTYGGGGQAHFEEDE